VPDIWVARSTVTKIKSNPFRIKERDLAKHLENGNDSDKSDGIEKVDKTAKDKKKKEAKSVELASTDYQLNEALTLLKGLRVLSGKVQPKG
jgi:hypothetical protein